MEAFQATVALVRPELQKQVILIGSAASTAHKSTFYTEDVDILAPKLAIQDIGRILEGAGLFFFFFLSESVDGHKQIRISIGIIQLP